MPKIQTLSREEAQKIAAGEVVERPASVVKELVENSIDAGATVITVTIKDGGKQVIACSDNGCGMDPVDAHLCIKAHATSKITKLDDLFDLHTFGFRGEALASLAAVSDLIITTKDAHHTEGLRLTLNDGIIKKEEFVAHEVGTFIEVKHLFKTVPARLKFLKKSDTEERHIAHLFDALFLSHPDIHAKLIVDESITKNYPATKSIHQRAEQILMHKTQSALIPVAYQKKGVSIEGGISNHQTYRFDKSSIYIFVNRRWVKNIGLTRAVLRAYTVLPKDKFPIVSLHITIDPSVIDVNIHPRKEEVAFTDNYTVEQAVTTAIKEALEKELSTALAQPYISPSSQSWMPITHSSLLNKSFTSEYITPQELHSPMPQLPEGAMYKQEDTPFKSAETSIASHLPFQESISHAQPEESFFTLLGQLDTTYIIASTHEGLTIVDQHAAHERVLYEQFVSRFGTIDTVQLLFPEILHVNPADYDLIITYQELLTQHGILAEPFGAQQIRVTALPVFAKHVSAQETINALITTIHEMPTKADAHQFITNALRAQMACKAAVKAGDTLSHKQMEQLLRDLAKTPNRLTCPHGRPTYWTITITELEKKFQRIT